MVIFLIIVLWFLCGLVGAGIFLADDAREFPQFSYPSRHKAYLFCGAMAIAGPIFLLAALIMSSRPFQIRFTCLSAEESWQAFHHKYPSLPKESWLHY